MGTDSRPTEAVSPLHQEVEERFGVLPGFFRLTPAAPEITENLWGFAKFGYLDNPLPSLFKERLFVYLSQFCEVRYCISRHVGFLMGLGRPAGDSACLPETVEQVVRLIRRPFPEGEAMQPHLDYCQAREAPLDEFPAAESFGEEAIITLAAHVFLQTAEAGRCLKGLRRALGDVRHEHLLVFLTFVRTAHYWTKLHPELEQEEDIVELLKVHEGLAACVLRAPEASGNQKTQVLLDELVELRKEREQAELLRVTFASIGDAVIVTDSYGKIRTLNAVAQELTGWSSEEAREQPLDAVFRVVNEETGKPAKNLANWALQEESIVRQASHTLLIAKDGSKRPVDDNAAPIRAADGQIIGCVLVFRDMTERQRETSLLSEQNQLLEQVVRGGPLNDLLDAVCLAVERHVAEGVVATVLLMDEQGELLRPAAGRRCPEAYAAAIDPVPVGAANGSCGTAAHRREMVVVADIAEDPLWSDFRQAALPHGLRSCWSTPILCSAGNVLGTLAVYSPSPRRPSEQDLRVMEFLGRTAGIAIERRRTEDAMRKSEQEAQQANRAKSEFLANMSHEIRTPMAAILGHADILLAHLKDADNRGCVNTIKRNGGHLLDIINDILDISRIEAGKLELAPSPCRLVKVLADLWSLMHVRVEGKPVDFKVVVDGPLPDTIQTDPKRLRQILINLLGNAIKFTEAGWVTLRVKPTHSGGESAIEFAVEDTGVGIPQENLKRLFESFSQGDASVTRRFGGSGLGLAISKRLTVMLGGELTVTSTEGVGSTFRLLLPTGPLDGVPLVEFDLNGITHDVLPSRIETRLECRVLLVDDRRDVRYVAQHIMEEAGATVTTANDGQEGIDAIRRAVEGGQAFDLVVMDMQMPNLDGYTATSELRSTGHELPILALTADAMSGDRDRCLNAGCDDYLSKPIEAAGLIEKVRRLTLETPIETLRAERASRKDGLFEDGLFEKEQR